jgi:hypothetical protein
MATNQGECFCGAVRIEVSGEPEGMGLPLPIMPFLVGWARKRLHIMETGPRSRR